MYLITERKKCRTLLLLLQLFFFLFSLIRDVCVNVGYICRQIYMCVCVCMYIEQYMRNDVLVRGEVGASIERLIRLTTTRNASFKYPSKASLPSFLLAPFPVPYSLVLMLLYRIYRLEVKEDKKGVPYLSKYVYRYLYVLHGKICSTARLTDNL